uniref:ATP synthase subunit a n=1 Tax=Armadillidium vulgare TaxID=13347 RepID=A0A221SE58_ARMVU|nr:ATP synthase F0 subunit 6 [Armadillidium vulgare]
MMTNLFSVFDPSSSMGLSMNWVSLILGMFLIPFSKWVVNSRWVVMMELLVMKLYSEMKVLFSSNSKMVAVIFSALFLFIMFNNIMGLTPYVYTATSHLAVTLSLALPLWLGYFMFGWVMNCKWMLAHLMPQGTPGLLMPFMVIIESVSSLIRPGTLAVRLMANMIAGHLLLVLVSSSVVGLSALMFWGIVLTQILLVVLEVAVAIIQSYVLVILSVLYSSEV